MAASVGHLLSIFRSNKTSILAVSLFLCCLIAIILIYLLVESWSIDINMIEKSAFTFGSFSQNNMDYEVYFGLQGFVTTASGKNLQLKQSYQAYGRRCAMTVCESCRIAGIVTYITLMSSTTVLLFLALFTTLSICINSESITLKRLNIISSLFLWTTITISFGYWNENCFQQIILSTFRVYKIRHYTGFQLILIAWFLVIIIIAIHTFFFIKYVPRNPTQIVCDEDFKHVPSTDHDDGMERIASDDHRIMA
jgi:hypothetical protein